MYDCICYIVESKFYNKENILDPFLRTVSYEPMYPQKLSFTFKNKGFIVKLFCYNFKLREEKFWSSDDNNISRLTKQFHT